MPMTGFAMPKGMYGKRSKEDCNNETHSSGSFRSTACVLP